jgi:hypothetical protein
MRLTLRFFFSSELKRLGKKRRNSSYKERIYFLEVLTFEAIKVLHQLIFVS